MEISILRRPQNVLNGTNCLLIAETRKDRQVLLGFSKYSDKKKKKVSKKLFVYFFLTKKNL